MLRTAVIVVCVLCIYAQTPCRAVNFGATTDGDWSNPATWTPAGGPPGSGDTVVIGSNSPAGSAATATVSLTSGESATTLHLGTTAGTDGTLDLGSFELSLSDSLIIGTGVGSITRTTGHFEVPELRLQGTNNLTLSANDNISRYVTVNGASAQLTLAAPMTLSQDLDIRSGATVDLANQDLSVRNLYLGWLGGSGFSLLNDGAISVSNELHVNGADFTFDADDSTTDLSVIDATVTLDPATQVRNLLLQNGGILSTVNATSLNNYVTVNGASSQLTLATPMTLTQDLDIRGGATVDLANHDISVRNLYLGWFNTGYNLLNDAAIEVSGTTHINGTDFTFDADHSTTDLSVIDATVTLDPATQVRNLVLQNGGVLSTVNATSVNNNATVNGASSQLTLTTPMTLTQDLDVRNGGIVDLANHDISVRNLYLGWFSTGYNLLNDAAIEVSGTTHVNGADFTFDADDSTTDLSVNDATVTLDPVTQIRNLTLQNGGKLSTINATSLNNHALVNGASSQLTLATPLTLANDLDVRNGGTVDLANQDLSVRHLYLGWFNAGYNLLNDAAIEVSGTTYINGTDFTFDADDTTTDLSVANTTVTLDPTTELRDVTLNNASMPLNSIAQIRNLSLQNGTMFSTVNATSVNNYVTVNGASTQLTLAAPMTLTQDLDIRGGGTVDLANQDISVRNLYLGWFNAGYSLLNDAVIEVSGTTYINGIDFTFDADDLPTDLNVANATVTLDPTTELRDVTLNNASMPLNSIAQIRNLSLQNGTMFSTVNATSVNNYVTVNGASTQLTLAAPMTLTQDLDIRGGSTVDLANQDISVRNLYLGWFSAGYNLLNDAAIEVRGTTQVNGIDFTFDADDSTNDLIVSDATVTLDPVTQVRNLTLQNGGMLTTVNATSINNYVTVNNASSQLTLTAPMTLTQDLDIRNDASVDLAGNDLKVRHLYLGWFSGTGHLSNDALVTTTGDVRIRRSDLTLTGEMDRIGQDLSITLGSTLAYDLDLNAPFGLYMGGSTLEIDGTSQLVLNFENNPAAFYSSAFRWKNPAGGDRVAELQSLIDSGRIVINSTNAANVVFFQGIDDTTNIGYFNDLPGDYDRNGVIDAADYAQWKLDFGSTVPNRGEGSDGNFDGVVNLVDYTIWRNNLGQSIIPVVIPVSIPEPSCLAILVGALSAFALARRGRAS